MELKLQALVFSYGTVTAAELLHHSALSNLVPQHAWPYLITLFSPSSQLQSYPPWRISWIWCYSVCHRKRLYQRTA